jgi:uncharacterized membrane protein YgcG
MATTFFYTCKLGPADKNNGVLILAVLDKKRIEIKVGRGLKRDMIAEWCTYVLRETAVPSCKKQEYGKDIVNTVAKVADRLRQIDREIRLATTFHFDEGAWLVLVMLAICSQFMEERFPLVESCPSCDSEFRCWECFHEWNTVIDLLS